MAKLAVIYYSATGHTYRVAQAVEEGAREAGAETRLRRVAETQPEAVIATNPAWQAHVAEASGVRAAALEDLEWADGYAFGAPTRYGVMAAALKQFFEGTGALWGKGVMANKPVAAFTGAANPHGGQETTLQTIYNVMYHWGAVIVPPGYTDRVVYAAGGNPYGVSYQASREGVELSAEVLQAARYLGGRLARFAAVLGPQRERL